jgi:hypothetical protein
MLLGVDVVGVGGERPPRHALVLVDGILAPTFRRRLLRRRQIKCQSPISR